MSEFRTERDSMGEVQVPAQAYYASQTQRAVENFPISGMTLPPALIHAMGLVKFACGTANRDLGKLTGSGKNPLSDGQVEAMLKACREVAAGDWDDQFPIDVFQTGSGTSSNMNVNEVISNRAIELLGGDRFAATKPVHPNDHVNMGQSTNDTFPTAIHVAVAQEITKKLIPALKSFEQTLREKATAWDKIIKIGRTHLADATPLRLGQEFGGFARQIELSVQRAERARDAVLELPVGGTAVGSGINTHPEFGGRVAKVLAQETGIGFVEAKNHFEANAQRDGLVECHGDLKAIASTLFNVANNIRWLGSGPRCGFYEIKIPDLQPGSLDHAGQGQPGALRKHAAGLRPRDGQRPGDRRRGGGGREFPAQHHDAHDGSDGLGKRDAAIQSDRCFRRSLCQVDRGQRRSLRSRGGAKSVDGDEFESAHWLRKSRSARERSLQDRQDHP